MVSEIIPTDTVTSLINQMLLNPSDGTLRGWADVKSERF